MRFGFSKVVVGALLKEIFLRHYYRGLEILTSCTVLVPSVAQANKKSYGEIAEVQFPFKTINHD